MELRVLEYFLAVAREQSISKAAQTLHLTQPTLSRQIRDMEEELGKQLLIRGNRKITLTEDGLLLRKRAMEILSLVNKTEQEIIQDNSTISGDIIIGTGETEGTRFISEIAKKLQKTYPLIHYHLVSGDADDIIDQLDKGLYDFGILMGSDLAKNYESLHLPYKNQNGVIMRKDDPLAKKSNISPSDLENQPLIVSRQQIDTGLLASWAGKSYENYNIVATYNLMYNASIMVEEGFGLALGFDGVIRIPEDSNLCFRRFSPPLEVDMALVWKKYQIFSKAAELFLNEVKEYLAKQITK